MLKQSGVQLPEPRFEGLPHGSGGRYVGQRGKQRKAGAGFTAKNYAGASVRATAAAVEPPQSALVLPSDVLSVRASSQKMASRIAGYSRAGADNDLVRQALMDLLSSDWTTPTSATGNKTRGSRAATAPSTAAAKPQRLPPIATSGSATLICDPHARSLNGALGADPPRWSGTRVRQTAPAVMATNDSWKRTTVHSGTRGAFALGPGDIETQVAAVAERIRASRPSAQNTRRSLEAATAPSPPRRSVCVLAMPNAVSPGKDIVAPSQPVRPMGRPRVAETNEERARKAVTALTNRYTVRIGAAAENAQIIGKVDPTWSAAETQRYSTQPGAASATKSKGEQASMTSRRRAPPPSAGRDEKMLSSPTKSQTTNEKVAAKVREVKPKVDTRRHLAVDRKTTTDRSACVTGKTMEKTERFGEFVELDMDAENGLTGWGELDE